MSDTVYIRFRTSCSLNFLNTFFYSKRELLLSDNPQLENSFGREELTVDPEIPLMREMSLLNENSSSTLLMME